MKRLAIQLVLLPQLEHWKRFCSVRTEEDRAEDEGLEVILDNTIRLIKNYLLAKDKA